MMNNLPISGSDIRAMLDQKMKDFGIQDIHVSWSEECIGKFRSLPDGPEKEALIDKGLLSLMLSLADVHIGKYTNVYPVADTPPMDPKVQEIINSVSIK